ncbi:MAG: YHS domain protein [Rhizobiaceae bacterium]|nr:YHS domain protein [Rhizobiaceae bacterium]
MMNRRTILIRSIGLIAAAPAVSATFIAVAQAGKPAIFTGLIDGVGAGGYDLVAYFADNAARRGDAQITADHDGVTYRFASAANRDLFAANPERYLPAYGGYCAFAVANGYTAKIDPEAFTVADGRLFLNFSKSVRTRWLKEQAANIAKGDANWPAVLAK